MFEDSTFESTGRIHTRSRRWMIATFVLNGSILLALILIPLIYPDALPRQAIPFLVVTPAVPTQPPPQERRPLQTVRGGSEMQEGQIVVPTRIPPGIKMVDVPEPPQGFSTVAMDQGSGLPTAGDNPFGGRRPMSVVPAVPNVVHVSSMVVAGLLIWKTIPPYPPIAKAAGVQGTVILEAMISKSGTIENLHVLSGPPMLQQAAVDAVRTWRYRPYMLNQQPVEVETTVNVVFTLAH
jgi:protein TonB